MLRMITAVALLAALVLFAGCWPSRPEPLRGRSISAAPQRAARIEPVSLRAVYRDTRIVPDATGDSAVHQGSATYHFTNNLPTPVKLVFPPIGFTAGGALPLTPSCNDVESMPEFCRERRTVELAPGETGDFKSAYTVLLAHPFQNPTPWHVELVFGPAPAKEEPGVFIGIVSCDSVEFLKPPEKDAGQE